MTVTTSLVSAPWATIADIPAGSTTPAGGWDGPLADASDILYELSGRQFRGRGQSRVQVTGTVPRSQSRTSLLGQVYPFASVSGRDRPHPGLGVVEGGVEVVRLPSSPVVSVDEVTINGDGVDAASYWCDTTGLLRRTDGRRWPGDGSLEVTFTHGIPPPAGGVRACVSLATELGKARSGDGSCRLRNFQTVTREGVTMAAVNLREALAASKTGLYEVDLWLQSVNPHGLKRRASAWSPDHGRTRRVQGSPLLPGPGADYVPVVNLDVYVGDDRSFAFPVLDAAGNPFPLDDYTVRAQVRDRAGGRLLHEWSTASGNAAAAAGAVSLRVADSERWSFSGGVYDVQLIDPQGRVEVLARGRVRVVPGVTS